MTLLSSLLYTLRQSGSPGHNSGSDFRPITLRHQVSLILPFGQPVSLDPMKRDFRGLALRRRLLAVLLLSAVWRSWSH
jgi:hypothetical protein